MEYLKVVLDAVIPTLAPILAMALGLIATWAVHQLAKKFNLDVSAAQDAAVQDAAAKAVFYAEEWARKQTKGDPTKPLPDGPAKLKAALEFVNAVLDEKHVKAYGQEALAKVIEQQLHVVRYNVEQQNK